MRIFSHFIPGRGTETHPFVDTHILRPQEKIKKKKSKRARATLSFAGDDEEEDQPRLSKPSKKPKTVSPQTLEASTTKGTKKTSVKNPSVDTSFLPDRQREEQERQIREDLRQEWLRKQEKMKQEEIEITYSYWDGSGHRKTVKVRTACTLLPFIPHLSPPMSGVDTSANILLLAAFIWSLHPSCLPVAHGSLRFSPLSHHSQS